MTENQAERFPQIDFLRFPISIDKNHLTGNDFYQFRFSCIDLKKKNLQDVTTPETAGTLF